MSIEFQDCYFKANQPNLNHLVIVTGLSGSGKDYLLSELAKTDEKIGSRVAIVNFGSLLYSKLMQSDYDHRSNTSRDDLNKFSPERVKTMVVSLISEVVNQQPAIVNTHVAYIQQGSIQINMDILRALMAKNYVYVWSDPEQVCEWRTRDLSRKREQIDLTDISLHQQIAFESTRAIARVLGLGFRSLYNRKDNLTENLAKLHDVIEDI